LALYRPKEFFTTAHVLPIDEGVDKEFGTELL